MIEYTLSEAWSGVNWADVINIGPKGALGSHEIRPIHSAPSLGQSIIEKKRKTLLLLLL